MTLLIASSSKPLTRTYGPFGLCSSFFLATPCGCRQCCRRFECKICLHFQGSSVYGVHVTSAGGPTDLWTYGGCPHLAAPGISPHHLTKSAQTLLNSTMKRRQQAACTSETSATLPTSTLSRDPKSRRNPNNEPP
jgi:hypothetical protein